MDWKDTLMPILTGNGFHLMKEERLEIEHDVQDWIIDSKTYVRSDRKYADQLKDTEKELQKHIGINSLDVNVRTCIEYLHLRLRERFFDEERPMTPHRKYILLCLIDHLSFKLWPSHKQEEFTFFIEVAIGWKDFFLSYTNKNTRRFNKQYPHH